MPPAAKKSTNTNRTHPYEKNSTAPDMASPTSPTARNNSSKAWNKEADDQLLQARKQGMNWEPIARKYFPSKTANACRKRHERLQEKLHHEEAWDPSKLEAMAMSYVQYREQIWKVVAERLDERWQDVESRVIPRCYLFANSTDKSLVYGARVKKSAQPGSSPQPSQRPQNPKRQSQHRQQQ